MKGCKWDHSTNRTTKGKKAVPPESNPGLLAHAASALPLCLAVSGFCTAHWQSTGGLSQIPWVWLQAALTFFLFAVSEVIRQYQPRLSLIKQFLFNISVWTKRRVPSTEFLCML